MLFHLLSLRIKAKEERIVEGVRMKMMLKSENWSSRKKGNVSGVARRRRTTLWQDVEHAG